MVLEENTSLVSSLSIFRIYQFDQRRAFGLADDVTSQALCTAVIDPKKDSVTRNIEIREKSHGLDGRHRDQAAQVFCDAFELFIGAAGKFRPVVSIKQVDQFPYVLSTVPRR